MTSIIDRLNSGELHAAARARRPDCVDRNGNIHRSPERRDFVEFMLDVKAEHGDDHNHWPRAVKREYRERYVPSH